MLNSSFIVHKPDEWLLLLDQEKPLTLLINYFCSSYDEAQPAIFIIITTVYQLFGYGAIYYYHRYGNR